MSTYSNGQNDITRMRTSSSRDLNGLGVGQVGLTKSYIIVLRGVTGSDTHGEGLNQFKGTSWPSNSATEGWRVVVADMEVGPAQLKADP